MKNLKTYNQILNESLSQERYEEMYNEMFDQVVSPTPDIQKMQEIVAAGFDLNKNIESYYMNINLLKFACMKRMYPGISALLEVGADPNSRDEYGSTPLHHSVGLRDLKMARILLDAGADANIQNDANDSPLYLAIQIFNPKVYAEAVEFLKVLLKNGADPNLEGKDGRNSVSSATVKLKPEFIKPLVDAGGDPNGLSVKSNPLKTILSLSGTLKEGLRVQVVRDLLESGSDPNIRIKESEDRKESTLIGLSVRNHSPKGITKLLLLYGANWMDAFNDLEELLKYFEGDLSWWENPPASVRRLQRSEDLFGEY